MKKIVYLIIILFVLVLGMQMGNDTHSGSIQDQINNFEDSIENGEDLGNINSIYYIEEGIVNKLAKKSESIVKKVVGKFKEFLN